MNCKQGVAAVQRVRLQLEPFVHEPAVAASDLGVAGALPECHTLEVVPAAETMTGPPWGVLRAFPEEVPEEVPGAWEPRAVAPALQ